MEQQQRAPKDIRAVADFLRSSKAGMKTRIGVLNGKRHDYFKGKAAIKALLSPTYAKLGSRVPPVTSEEDAVKVLNSVIPYAFYLRVSRPTDPSSTPGSSSSGGGKSPKILQINPMQQFLATDLYAWFYEGSQLSTYLGGLGMVGLLLAGVMFPLWPAKLRLGVWYLSIGVLGLIGLFIIIAILRLIFYIGTIVVAPPGIWVFPKLFADVGVIESFIPFWEWDLPKKKKGKKSKKDAADDSIVSEKGKGKGIVDIDASGFSSGVGLRPTTPQGDETSGDSRPTSRQATVEDAADED